ncbi:MAG: gluconate 2-dehydrogenase subunit 3 family protein [Acidobacteriota bacterium]
MKQLQQLRRRRFLAAAAAAPLAGCGGRKSPWRFFTTEEAETVSAFCEQIIPADQDPGATQAGVIHYIDRHLMGHFRRYQEAYRKGVAAIEQASAARHGKRFAQLAAGQQTELLNGLTGEAQQFFSLVVAHAMQGFYGDPRHGGNRDAVSWKMLGVPLIPVRGRAQYDLTKPQGSRT